MNGIAHPSLQEAASGVDVRALAAPPEVRVGPRMARRRSITVGVLVAALVALLAGAGLWWQSQVTGDAGLEFYGGPNVYRDEASTDYSGIERRTNLLGDEVDVAFVRHGRLFVHFGLFNGGAHDVRVEAVPPGRYYYWGFDRISLGSDPDDGFVGVAQKYEPFRPFTLHRGETREVRLEYRQAGCDPSELQPGGTSSVRSLRVRYRVLGLTRSAEIPFRDAVVALKATGICQDAITD